MASIYSGLSSSSHKPSLQPFKRRAYAANGWDPMRVWDGISASDAVAGLEGPGIEPGTWTPTPTEPGAGSVTGGTHKVRYRYKDSTTGYVSNPSAEATVTASGSKSMGFPAASSGAGNMILSADSKCDTIVVEMTDVGLEFFYVAGEGPNTAGTIVVDRSDTDLRELGEFPYPETGNNPPPLAKNLVAFKSRMFAFGQVKHSDGSVTATNASTTITGASTNWTSGAVGRFLRFSGEKVVYEIEAWVSATELTLKDAYQGSTGSGKGYTIFSRLNEIYFSAPGFPESWPSQNAIEALSEEEVRAVRGFGNSLVIFGLRTIEQFSYGDDPRETGQKQPVPGNRGALNQDVVVVVDNRVYSMDQTGLYVYDGGEPIHISRPVDARIQSQVDFNFSDKFHAVFYPRLRAIRWFVVKAGETECRMYLEFDVDRRTWGSGLLDFAATFSGNAPRGRGLGVMVGDETGGQWWDDEGTTIGVSPALANATVDAGATTTEVPLQGSPLPTSGNGLVGVPAYFPALGFTTRVTANTATTITLAAAAPSAPAENSACYLGRVVGKLRTKELNVAEDLKVKQRATFLWLQFQPLEEQRFARVRFYADQSDSPIDEWDAATYAAGRLAGEGVTAPATGESDWLIDLSKSDGTIRIPVGFGARRTLSAELEVLQPDTPLKLYRYELGAVYERSLA